MADCCHAPAAHQLHLAGKLAGINPLRCSAAGAGKQTAPPPVKVPVDDLENCGRVSEKGGQIIRTGERLNLGRKPLRAPPRFRPLACQPRRDQILAVSGAVARSRNRVARAASSCAPARADDADAPDTPSARCAKLKITRPLGRPLSFRWPTRAYKTRARRKPPAAQLNSVATTTTTRLEFANSIAHVKCTCANSPFS